MFVWDWVSLCNTGCPRTCFLYPFLLLLKFSGSFDFRAGPKFYFLLSEKVLLLPLFMKNIFYCRIFHLAILFFQHVWQFLLASLGHNKESSTIQITFPTWGKYSPQDIKNYSFFQKTFKNKFHSYFFGFLMQSSFKWKYKSMKISYKEVCFVIVWYLYRL